MNAQREIRHATFNLAITMVETSKTLEEAVNKIKDLRAELDKIEDEYIRRQNNVKRTTRHR